MGRVTKISWTNSSVNFWFGCHHVSEGCDHCYADHITTDLWKKDFNKPWRNPKAFVEPLTWKDERFVFTCSMSDFFLNEADPWRGEAWDVIRCTPNLTWQILTKRPQRIKQCLPEDWGEGYPNAWLGVSVELPMYYGRIEELVKIPAKGHFVSAEPLLADLPNMPLRDIEWVICGGESGPNFRPMEEEWVRDIKLQCERANIAFFYKQPSGLRTELPAILDGREWKTMPTVPTNLYPTKVI